MIPFCLIVGDSTGAGTASTLAAEGIRCKVYARVGARSAALVAIGDALPAVDRCQEALRRAQKGLAMLDL